MASTLQESMIARTYVFKRCVEHGKLHIQQDQKGNALQRADGSITAFLIKFQDPATFCDDEPGRHLRRQRETTL